MNYHPFNPWRRVLVPVSLAAVVLSGFVVAAPHVARGATAPAQSSKNTLTIGWSIETKTLDPAGNSQNPDIWVQVNIFDKLVQVAPNGTNIVPDLATTWSMSNRGKVYTFHLRKGIKFQNGAPVTAKDVAFCINRARKPAAAWSWTLTAVKNVTAPNSRTVRITLKHPWAPLLSDVSLFDTGVYPEAYFKKVGASGMATHPIGSGPYKFVTWKRGQYILLQKDPHYWNAAKYPMQYVEYELIPNDNTRLLQTEAGQLDVDNVLPWSDIASVTRSGKAQVQINRSTETMYITALDTLPQFKDVHVRQAINHAIDRAALVRAILFGHGTPANSFMPKGALDYDPNIPVPSYNMTLAKKDMSESKYKHGFTITMEVPSGDSVSNSIDVILKSELKPLGITLNLRQEDQTTLFNNQQKAKYHLTNNLWTNDIPDPDELVSFAVDYNLPASRSFFTWYDNPTLSRLSSEAEQTNSASRRQHDYYEIQTIFMQQIPFWPLFYVPFANAVANGVHGFSENPLGYFNLQGVHKS
ncbi:MAG TPA: ABC transporter substrate-binding protein [Chloroflexota bacterium]|nr:ABC transporter substrate-binding protein [Chloroflexota bacterium]